MERMKQTVIQVNTIRLIQLGEPAEDRRSLIAPTKHDEPHRQNTIIDEETVWVIGDSMFHKGRYVNTRDLCGQNVAKPRRAGVRAAIVVMKRGNSRGAIYSKEGGRKTNGKAP